MSKAETVRSVVNQWAKDHIIGDATPMAFLTEANREDLIARLDRLRPDLEAARGEIERLKKVNRELLMVVDSDEFDVMDRLLKESRATEAELRARVERLEQRLPKRECRIDPWFSGGCPCDCHQEARAALDAQESREHCVCAEHPSAVAIDCSSFGLRGHLPYDGDAHEPRT